MWAGKQCLFLSLLALICDFQLAQLDNGLGSELHCWPALERLCKDQGPREVGVEGSRGMGCTSGIWARRFLGLNCIRKCSETGDLFSFE